MALEDLAAFRAIHGTTVLYPADGNTTVRLVASMADLPGISYLRTTREATPVLYGPDESFPVGGSKTLRHGNDAALVAAGITLHEALRAADRLDAEGIAARVLDCYSVKPIDGAALRGAAAETGLIVVVEDHRLEGGLGDAVLEALASEGALTARVIKLAVTDMPGSGTPEELRAWAGIDADAIVDAVRGALGRDRG
jgi:transketolase